MACSKVRYVSRAKARQEAKKLRRRGSGPVRAYFCLECHLWHLTSQTATEFQHHVEVESSYSERERQHGS